MKPGPHDEYLRDVWFDERVLLRDMAVEMGCTSSNVSARARKLGLPTRTRGCKPSLDGGLRFADADVALIGGQWVPNGRGVMVWQATELEAC